MTVRTRIAPSPTGDPHVGTIYIALFNYAFAKKMGGKFILRMEDTDQKRSLPIYEKNIIDSLKWAGLSYDEGPVIGGPYGPYRQSERLPIYQEYIQILLKEKKAYKCFCTSEELEEMRQVAAKLGQKSGYDRRCRNLSDEEIKKREDTKRPYVVRLKVPLTGECFFHDEIKGDITTPWSDIDDQVLMKSDGFPTYHFAAVVDDHLMKITHIIRGDEWISSTPKHVLLYDLFGWERPKYHHMPLLLGADGRKLSKRRNPTSTFYFRDSGYLPQALLNFLSLMGYSMSDGQEVYSLKTFIETFDITRIGTSGAFFDIKKLDWLNQKYIIETLSEDSLLDELKKFAFNDENFKKMIPLVKTRMKTFGEFMELCDFLFINHIHFTEELLTPQKIKKELSAAILQTVLWFLDEDEEWNKESIEEASHFVENLFSLSHKKIIMPILFAALMGKTQGLPLFASFEILGKYKTRARLLLAIEALGGISKKMSNELKKAYDKKDAKDLVF